MKLLRTTHFHPKLALLFALLANLVENLAGSAKSRLEARRLSCRGLKAEWDTIPLYNLLMRQGNHNDD